MDATNGSLLFEIERGAPVHSISFSADGSTFAVGGQDNQAVVYSGLESHGPPVSSVPLDLEGVRNAMRWNPMLHTALDGRGFSLVERAVESENVALVDELVKMPQGTTLIDEHSFLLALKSHDEDEHVLCTSLPFAVAHKLSIEIRRKPQTQRYKSDPNAAAQDCAPTSGSAQQERAIMWMQQRDRIVPVCAPGDEDASSFVRARL